MKVNTTGSRLPVLAGGICEPVASPPSSRLPQCFVNLSPWSRRGLDGRPSVLVLLVLSTTILICGVGYQPLSSRAFNPELELPRATALRSNFHRQVQGLPSSPLALEDVGLIFLCLLHPLFPGYCKLDKSHLLGNFRSEDNIRSEASVGYLLWEFGSARISQSLVVARTLLLLISAASALLPDLKKWMKQGPFYGVYIL